MKYLKSLLFAAMFFFHTDLQAQVSGIALTPVEVFIAGAPGTTVNKEATVINSGNTAFLLICYYGDLWYDLKSVIRPELGKVKERQAGTWMQCSPNRIIVPPGTKQKIKLLGALPKEAEGDYFTNLYVEMQSPDQLKKEGNVRIDMSGRIGAKVVVTASGTEKPSFDIIDPIIKKTKKFQTFNATLKNTGNIHLRGDGTLVLTDDSDKTIAKVDIKVPFSFPKQTVKISSTFIDNVPPGSFKAILSFSSNTGKPVIKEFRISVSN